MAGDVGQKPNIDFSGRGTYIDQENARVGRQRPPRKGAFAPAGAAAIRSPHVGVLKQQEFILSQFWGPEV